MAFGGNRPLPGRGPAPGFRFTLYAALAIVLMFLDQRGGWLEQARYGLSAAAYPIQLAVNSPSAAWTWLRQNFETRASLQAENEALRARSRELALRTMRYEALEAENANLRGLRTGLPDLAERWLPAEVINVELSSLRQRLLINKGSRHGVFRGQAVVANDGLLGQVMRVGPWSAEIILITDPEHAVPVQVVRSGLRTIAVGQGTEDVVTLPYLPLNSDVQEDDLLVTSGLGGVFPAGYAVARVTEVGRDPGQPLAQVRAVPLAKINRDRVVALVWFKPGHPAAPGTPAEDAAVAEGTSTEGTSTDGTPAAAESARAQAAPTPTPQRAPESAPPPAPAPQPAPVEDDE